MSLFEEMFGEPAAWYVQSVAKQRKLVVESQVDKKLKELQRTLIPIYKVQDDDKTAIHTGTGFLLSYDDGKLYLFTCGHVVDNIFKNETEYELWVFYDGQLRQINQNAILNISKSEKNNRKDDNIDFAAYEITDSSMKDKLTKEYSLLDSKDVLDKWRTPERIVFASLGFPETKNRIKYNARSLKNQPYAYLGMGIPFSDYCKYGLNPDVHIAFKIDYKKCKDESGKIISAPQPNGISGGPIFPMYLMDDLRTVSMPSPLIGHTTFCLEKEGIIYGTRIAPLLVELGDNEW